MNSQHAPRARVVEPFEAVKDSSEEMLAEGVGFEPSYRTGAALRLLRPRSLTRDVAHASEDTPEHLKAANPESSQSG